MPTHIQNQWSGLTLQKGSAGNVSYLTELTNAYLEEDGTIRSRLGIIRISDAQVGDGAGSNNIHSIHLRGDQRYTGVGTVVRLGANAASPIILSGLNGDRLTFVDAAPSPATTANSWTYFANGQAATRYKNAGTGANTSASWGIDGPSAATVNGLSFSVTTSVPATTTVEAFNTGAASFTVVGTSGTLTVLTTAGTTPAYAGSAALGFTMPAKATDRARRTGLTIDMSPQTENGYLRVMMRVDNGQNLDQVEIAFDVSSALDFIDDYYYYRLSTSVFATDNTWQEFKIRKRDFTRVRPTGGSTRTWANVDAVQLTVTANSKGQAVVSFDDMRVEADTHPDGTYEYKTTFWNDNLKIRSNSRLLADIYSSTSSKVGLSVSSSGQVSVRRQGIAFDRPAATTATTNVDAQVTHWEVWRKNINTGANFQFSQRLTIATTAQTDTTGDIALGEALVEDNNIPPPGRIIIGYDDRIFIMGMSNVTAGSGEEEASYAIRHSRKSYLESFPFSNLTLVGDQVDTIQNAEVWGGVLFVLTKKHVYQVIGTGGSYIAQRTEAPIGLESPYSVAVSPHGIFYRALDGVYLFTGGTAIKISGQIDPIFIRESITLDGLTVSPLDANTQAEADGVVGGYAFEQYRLTYTDTLGARTTLIYDVRNRRWHRAQNATAQSGWAIQRYAWEKAGTTDLVDNLEAGTSDGWVVLLSSPTNAAFGVTDGGAATIPIAVQTKALDAELKSPDVEADIKDIVVDMDSGGQTVTVQVSFDDTAYVSLGTSSSSGRDKLFFPVNSGQGTIAYKVAIRVTVTQATSRVTIFGIGALYEVEPKRTRSFSTQFTDEGWQRSKLYQEFQLEANTFGAAVTVDVRNADDNTVLESFTLNTATRRRQVFSYTPTRRATLIRYEFSSGANEWKLYGIFPQYTREPLTISRIETEIESLEAEAFYKALVLDIDPLGTAVSIEVYIDDALSTTFATTATTGHDTQFFSMVPTTGSLTRGSNSRIRLTSTGTFRYYRHRFLIDDEPIPIITWETEVSNDGGLGEKFYRSLATDIDPLGTAVDIEVFIDGTSVGTFTTTATTGRNTQYFSLGTFTVPPYRGVNSKLKLKSSAPFLYYTHTFQTDIDSIPLAELETQISLDEVQGEKFYRTLALEIDPRGTPARVEIFLDNTSVGFFFTPGRSGRDTDFFSLDTLPGAPLRGINSRIRVRSTGTFFYYGHVFRVDNEAVPQLAYESVISDDGHGEEKLYEALFLEIDTQGQAVTATVTVYTGTDTITETFSGKSTPQRQLIYLSFSQVRRGRLSSIKITAESARPFFYYRHTLFYIREPARLTFLETERTDSGWPGAKLFQQLVMEIDTLGLAATVEVFLDDGSKQIFVVTTTGRDTVTRSLTSTPEGRISFIRVLSLSEFRYYKHSFRHVPQPLDISYFDSTPMRIFTRPKGWTRRGILILQSTASVNGNLFINGTSIYTFSIATQANKAMVPVVFPTGTQGSIIRMTLSSDGTFRLFPESYLEVKELGVDQGYGEWRFAA